MITNFYHLAVKVFNRGRNSCAAVLAYRVGIALKDPYDGRIRYPRRRLDQIQSHFIVNWDSPGRSEGSSKKYQEIIDNIGRSETRCNSRLFREIEISLPREGTNEERSSLTERFAEVICRHYGISILAGLHEPPNFKTKNYHVHLLLLTRKTIWDNGYPELGVKVRDLDRKETLKKIRKLWEKMLKQYYRDHQIDRFVSCESYKSLGIERIPTIHEGPGARMRGGDRPNINSHINSLNSKAVENGTTPQTILAEGNASLQELKKVSEKLGKEIHETENSIRKQHEGRTLTSRQKGQVLSIRKIIKDANSNGASLEEIVVQMKTEMSRSERGRNALNRLKASLPLVGGEEIWDARDGVDLIKLLFETESPEALEKLKKWATGEVVSQPVVKIDFDDPFFLDRFRDWENLSEELPPPPVGGGREYS